MFRSTLFAAVMAFAAVASAQNYSTSGALSVDLTQISPALLQSWCRAQTNSCPQICGGRAFPNNCTASTLEWTCTCTNGNTPNISDYQQTVPALVCEQWKTNCVANHPNDLDGQTGCLSVTCGNRTTNDETSTTSASASGSSATASTSSTGASTEATASESASNAASSATETSAAIAMHVGQNYGTGIIGAGLLALFGLAL